MKKIVTTTVCDMAHTAPVDADHTVTLAIAGPSTRAAREIDLCNACAKKFVEPMFRNARIVKRTSSAG